MRFTDLMAEILELVRIDAEHFGCVDEVTHALAIVERSGHLAPMEQPEAVTAHMRRWLEA